MYLVPFVAAVVCVLMLLLVLWLVTSPRFYPEPDPELVDVHLQSPIVDENLIGNDTCWTILIFITEVTRGADVRWEDVTINIKGGDGRVLIAEAHLSSRDPLYTIDYGSDGKIELRTWFYDEDEDNIVEPGDAIELTGLTRQYEGGFLSLDWKGYRVGEVYFPTDFP